MNNTLVVRTRASESGIATILVVGFMGIFTLILGTVTSYAFQQAKYGRVIFAREQAIHIAEAGIGAYRWRISHDIVSAGTMTTTGAGLSSLPSSYTVSDPEGGTVGSATLSAAANLQCGVVQWIDLSSTGRANTSVGFPRTILTRYMKRSVAEYAFVSNNIVHFGSTNVGSGPYHSNNGMRMDGWSNSTASAAVSQVYCDGSAGSLSCDGNNGNPSPGWKGGVFGNSTTTALWKFPVSTIDFSGMALPFSTLKGYAQTYGIMLNPTSVKRAGVTQGSTFSSVGSTDQKGFHLVFKSDGTIDVYRVTATLSAYAYNGTSAGYSYPIISSESFVANVSLPSDCSIVYSEAKTWIDGTVGRKITVITADTGSFAPDVILNGNISYSTLDGSVGLTVVAEHSVMLGLVVPSAMSIRGIFVAQTGYYGRDYYYSGYTNGYDSYIYRSSLTVTGSIVSNLRAGVWWGSNNGFQYRYNYYDRVLAFSPPPFTPAITTDYSMQLWREQ